MAVYDGESTDELCLVKTAALHGVVLKQRALDRVDVRLQSPPSSAAETRSRILRFRLVKTLPFDSQRKCMSVLLEPLCSTTVVNSSNKSAERKGESLKSVSDGKYLLLCKGADETILAALDASSSIENTEHQKQLMLQETTLRKYSDQGLRTLCLAYRWIQKDVVDSLIENMKLVIKKSDLFIY
jgi:magnesium-transporting ATPase (P-type)